jgi:hypothetical protein
MRRREGPIRGSDLCDHRRTLNDNKRGNNGPIRFALLLPDGVLC